MNTREVTNQYRFNQWTEIVRQCRSSAQPVALWCAENNIKLSSYYYWLRRIRKAACNALPSLNENNPIVPLNIPDDTVKMDSSNLESSSVIELSFGDVKLEIRNTASATLIENTLRALHHVR